MKKAQISVILLTSAIVILHFLLFSDSTKESQLTIKAYNENNQITMVKGSQYKSLLAKQMNEEITEFYIGGIEEDNTIDDVSNFIDIPDFPGNVIEDTVNIVGGSRRTFYHNQGSDYLRTPEAIRALGGRTFSRTGCGPSAISTSLMSLGFIDADPITVGAWMRSNGFFTVATVHTSIVPTSEHFGAQAEFIPRTKEAIVDALSNGKYIVAMINANGSIEWNAANHYICVRALTTEGKVLLADPGKRANNAVLTYTPEDLLSSLVSSDYSLTAIWR